MCRPTPPSKSGMQAQRRRKGITTRNMNDTGGNPLADFPNLRHRTLVEHAVEKQGCLVRTLNREKSVVEVCLDFDFCMP